LDGSIVIVFIVRDAVDRLSKIGLVGLYVFYIYLGQYVIYLSAGGAFSTLPAVSGLWSFFIVHAGGIFLRIDHRIEVFKKFLPPRQHHGSTGIA